MEVKPMTPEEFSIFVEKSIISYANEKTRSGNWTEEEALDRAKEDYRRFLPQDEKTKNNYLYSLYNGNGWIGSFWIAVMPNHTGYIYNIEIEEQFRGQGYGKSAMKEIEIKAKELGLNKIELHVFAHNTTARRLYEKIGYEVTNVIMAKSI
ncbi:GNAT family N-acetyltransferase [Bacillus haikouensis]|jgi:ribosomal protein S18 acetylase RimI-like enzyme|uniref:GNAT family N-acetyltransferase n=1 Tax=Bacillus haikouensis TaxID=1510468 RepID=UPI001FE83C9B|nr:GNAT family N-acetyltransferase [Bacillus haikouensis]